MCLIDPVGDVYACPFAIHENFLAGNITTTDGGFQEIWQRSDLFTSRKVLAAEERLVDAAGRHDDPPM